MAVYDIYFNPRNIIFEWLDQQPNKVRVTRSVDKIICEFNHTAEESRIFKQEVANRLFQIDTGLGFENTIPKITALQKDDCIFASTPNITKNNLSTSYEDILPALFDGFPIPIHTLGYKKMGFVLLWNKNGGTSNHDVRIVKCDNSGNLLPDAQNPDVLIEGTNISSGRTTNFDFDVPAEFVDFRGQVKIQGKSGNGTDDPTLVALYIYLVRGET